MIKAMMGGSDDTKPTIMWLGLTHENLDRLRKGEPISFKGEEIGIEYDVFIAADKDEQAFLDAFDKRGMIDHETKIKDWRD